MDLCCRRGKFHIRQLFQLKKKPTQINKPLIWRHTKVLQTRSVPCLGFVLLSGSHTQRPAWGNQTVSALNLSGEHTQKTRVFRLQSAGEYWEFPTVLTSVELVGTSSIKNYISDALETQLSYRNDKKISKSSVKALAKIPYFISNAIAILVSNFYFILSDKWINTTAPHNLFLSISQTLLGSGIILDYKNISHLVYI